MEHRHVNPPPSPSPPPSFLPRFLGARLSRRAFIGGMVGAVVVGVVGVWGVAWQVPLPARLSVPGAAVLTYRSGEIAHVTLSPDERWRLDLTPDDIDPAYIASLIAAEDARFWWHPGVDPLAIGRATVQNLWAGRVVSGGSTLTMQLARMLEPRPRTLSSKLRDAARALQLEIRLTKPEILAAYLRFVPYGRNIEGVGAASLAYFGHPPDALTAPEIATLLAVPQRPADRFPDPAHTAALAAARDRIALRLLEQGQLPLRGQTADQIRETLAATAVPSALRPLPRAVPHVAAWLRPAPGTRVQTTLERGVQQAAESSLAEVRALAARRATHNAAVVVLEQETGDVVALVGGFDFWDEAHSGQVPAFAAPRSPGSALKPLLYAAALDAGLILPPRLVPDVPRRYGAYQPDNYDGRFVGVISIEEALSRSLNVPFVDLLAQYGLTRFFAQLQRLGVRSLRDDPGHYGLSLIVGGAVVTPLELASAYLTLSRDGQRRPPRILLTTEGEAAEGEAIFSPAAAWLTRRTLSRRDRPDFPSRAAVSATARSVWWKTGTSFGNRDAWAVGGGQRYGVAVWLGNLDNTASPWLVGAEAAAPVFFDLMEALGDDRGQPSPPPPASAQAPVEVCALSGHLPSEACPQRILTPASAQRVPPDRCPYHQAVTLDAETGLRLTARCRAGRPTRSAVYVVWPPEVRRWLQDQRLTAAEPPPLAPGCATDTAQPPRIRSPRAGEVALLLPGLSPDQQEIPLEADAAAGARLSWFVDGALLGTVDAGERLWWTPREGDHEVVVTDGAGRSDRAALSVRLGP